MAGKSLTVERVAGECMTCESVTAKRVTAKSMTGESVTSNAMKAAHAAMTSAKTAVTSAKTAIPPAAAVSAATTVSGCQGAGRKACRRQGDACQDGESRSAQQH